MFRFIFVVFFLPLFSIAQIPGPKPGTYINDYTNSLSPEQIRSLDESLLRLEQESTVQMAIVLIRKLPNNMSIEEYARVIGNTWKVGIRHNGLVYVAVLIDRRQRLEVARNLEGDIPDITAFEIIESLKPYLRQNDYYGALTLLVSQISDHVGGRNIVPDYPNNAVPEKETSESTPTPKELTQFEKEKARWNHYATYALWMLLTGAAGFSIWAWRYKRKYVKEHTVNGVYIGAGSSYFTSMYGSDNSDSGGSSGYGGFGGGGGGGFSGGGASGSW